MNRLVAIPMLLFATLCHAQSDRLQVLEESTYMQVGLNPPSLLSSVTLTAMLPDGSHAMLSRTSANPPCGGVQSYAPEKMPPDSKKCETSTPQNLTVTICIIKNLGSFRFKRKVNQVTIYSAAGKSQLAITESW